MSGFQIEAPGLLHLARHPDRPWDPLEESAPPPSLFFQHPPHIIFQHGGSGCAPKKGNIDFPTSTTFSDFYAGTNGNAPKKKGMGKVTGMKVVGGIEVPDFAGAIDEGNLDALQEEVYLLLGVLPPEDPQVIEGTFEFVPDTPEA